MKGCQNPVISEMRPRQIMIRPGVGCAGVFPLHRRRRRPDGQMPPDDLRPASAYAFFASR